MSIDVKKTITINKSPEELYRFWRNFENLPRFMNHLESVKSLDDKRSHSVAKAPFGNFDTIFFGNYVISAIVDNFNQDNI